MGWEVATVAASAIDRVITKIRTLEQAAARAGAGVGYGDDESTMIALANNYGTATIPARDFLTRGIDGARDSLGKRSLATGLDTDVKALLDAASAEYVKQIVYAIDTAAEWAEPLAESTIEEKGDADILGGRLKNVLAEVD